MEELAGQSARHEYEQRRDARRARLERRFGRLAPLAALIGGEPAAERNWRRGAEGEVRTAERLARRLKGRGVVVLHDRRIPGRRANIDHLAVGPAGITVIDSKNYKGKVAIRGSKLFVNGHNRTKLVYGAKHQCDVVRRALAGSVFAEVPVDAALAWVDVNRLPMLRTLRLDGVLIDGTRKIVKHAARRGSLSIAEIDQLAALLNDELPPALT
jgi:hypothetical protein